MSVTLGSLASDLASKYLLNTSNIDVDTVEVTLTNAQFKALPTTGIQLLAAPSAGRCNIPLLAVLNTDFSAAAYTNINAAAAIDILANATAFVFNRLKNNATDSLTAVTTLLGATKTITALGPYTQASSNAKETYGLPQTRTNMAAAWTIKANNGGSGDFTGGDSANSCKVRIWYIDLVL